MHTLKFLQRIATVPRGPASAASLTGDIAFLLGSRMALFAVVVILLGGDPNKDSAIFTTLAEHPVDHFLGIGPYPQFPQLLGFVFAAAERLVPSWVRGFFLICEALIYVAIWSSFRHTKRFAAFRICYLSGLFTAPLTAIWAQDEIWGVLPLVVLGLVPAKLALALPLALIGFFAFKQFYIFFVFVMLFGRRHWWQVATIAACLLLMVASDRTGGFVPSIEFCSNFWIFVPLPPALQKTLSLALVGGTYLLFELAAQHRRVVLDDVERFMMFFGLFLLLFYHINMEYFAFLLIPGAIKFLERRVDVGVAMFALAWFSTTVMVNVAFALLQRTDLVGLDVIHAALVWATLPLGAATLVFMGRAWLLGESADPAERTSER